MTVYSSFYQFFISNQQPFYSYKPRQTFAVSAMKNHNYFQDAVLHHFLQLDEVNLYFRQRRMNI